MKKHQIFIGVDVSKSKLDVCVLNTETHTIILHLIVENNMKAITQMHKQLKKELSAEVSSWMFCMEHTGAYTLPLCYFLSEQRLDYALVSGLEIHRSLGIKRGKNDKADAGDIARYACTHEPTLQLYQLPEKKLVKLKLLLAHCERLMKAKMMFQTPEEEQEFIGKELSHEIVKQSKSLLRVLDNKIAKVNAQMMELIAADEQLKKTYQLVSSVPGIGPQITCYLLVYTRCFTAFDNARQLACYAGVAPFEYSSGSSIRGRTKVSHIANKKLKALLNMGALTAKKLDKEMGLYYQRKVDEGKNKMLGDECYS